MLKSKFFRGFMSVLAIGVILWGLAAIISPSTFVPGYEQEEATELPAAVSFAGIPQEYATVNSFADPDRAVTTIYAKDYDRKSRCRTDHWLSGQMRLSKPFEVHNIEVVQAPGTPGGTSITGGDGAIEIPFPHTWKIVSNYPLTLGQIKDLIPPPYGYNKVGWADTEPYAPNATITYQNCLSPTPKTLPVQKQ